MNFKKFFKENDIPFEESLLVEYILLEREDDDRFREIAMTIAESIIRKFETLKGKRIYYFNKIKLYVGFSELSTDIKASYDSKIDLITINILNNKDLFEANIHKFIEDNKYALFHEVIHFLDYHRGNKFRANPQGSSISQINTPMEFNAYFHTFTQMIEDVVKEVSKSSNRNEAFNKHIGTSAIEFINKFWEQARIICKDEDTKIVRDILRSVNWKYKWEKRLFQLYYELYDKLINKNIKHSKNDLKEAMEIRYV
jgi:hypothetical protein